MLLIAPFMVQGVTQLFNAASSPPEVAAAGAGLLIGLAVFVVGSLMIRRDLKALDAMRRVLVARNDRALRLVSPKPNPGG